MLWQNPTLGLAHRPPLQVCFRWLCQRPVPIPLRSPYPELSAHFAPPLVSCNSYQTTSYLTRTIWPIRLAFTAFYGTLALVVQLIGWGDVGELLCLRCGKFGITSQHSNICRSGQRFSFYRPTELVPLTASTLRTYR